MNPHDRSVNPSVLDSTNLLNKAKIKSKVKIENSKLIFKILLTFVALGLRSISQSSEDEENSETNQKRGGFKFGQSLNAKGGKV
jgi:hypothetical protein